MSLSPLTVYQVLSSIRIAVNAIVGMLCLFAPVQFMASQGAPWNSAMVVPWGAWGATLLSLMAVYVPATIDPLGQRALNWLSIAIPAFMSLIWTIAGPGYVNFALWDAGTCIVLAVAYWRAISGV